MKFFIRTQILFQEADLQVEKTKNEVINNELEQRKKEIRELCKFLRIPLKFIEQLLVSDKENAVLNSENQLLKDEQMYEYSNTDNDLPVPVKHEDFVGCL